MPSILDKQPKDLVGLYIMEDKAATPASSTLNAAIAAQAASFVLAGASTFAIGQDCVIGTGERQEMFTISNLVTTTVTPAKPLEHYHEAGEPIVQQECVAIGQPETGGVRIGFNGETTDIFSAVQRMAAGKVDGYVDLTVAFEFYQVTADTLAFGLGIARSQIIGNGTAAAQTGTVGPRGFTSDGNSFGGRTKVNLKFVIRMQDGTYAALEFFNITFDPTAVSTTFSRGELSKVPVKLMASSGRADFTNSAWTPNTTNAAALASSGDVIQEIVSLNTLPVTGTQTTTTAGIAAGAFVIPVTSPTGIVSNSWVLLGTPGSDTAEVHWVNNVSSNNVLLRTQVFRAFASGATVTVLSVNEVSAVGEGGLQLQMSGSVLTKRAQQYRNSIGYQAQNCAMQLSAQLTSFTKDNLLQAFAIDSSVYANSIVPFKKSIGGATPVNTLFIALTQNQKFVYLVGWRCAAQIGGEMSFGAASETFIPFAQKPIALQLFCTA